MSNKYDALSKKTEAIRAQLTLALIRIGALIKERNHLEVQIVKRDMIIARYQKWFDDHTHLAKAIPYELSTDAQFTNSFHAIMDSQKEKS